MNRPAFTKDIITQCGDLGIRLSAQDSAGASPGRHYHQHANLVFILDGECLEKRQHHSYERKTSDIAFLHAGEIHETIFMSALTRYISVDIKPGLFAESDIDENVICSAVEKSPDAKFLILKIYAELLCNDDLSNDSIKMLFLEFASLSRIVGRVKTPPAWVNVVHELLNDRWSETITLKQLSEASGVNPVTISKHFPIYFACTLGSYLRKLRVERSLSMIKNHDSSLTQTAYACNFSDQSHFTRSFKAYTSLLPTKFRYL